MRRRALLPLLPLLVAASLPAWLLAACESSDAPGGALPNADAAGFDAPVSTTDGAPVDSAPGDAATEAGEAGDGGSDAGPTGPALFALIDSTLVSVDTTTGALTERGNTGYHYLSIAWDRTASVARVLYDQDTGPTAAAKLGTIDLCTGVVTPGPALAVGGRAVTYAEGLAQDPASGTFYITYRTAGTQTVTSNLGTIDPATAAITSVGALDTLQDDGDHLAFLGATLHVLDVAQPTNAAYYSVDPATAATTLGKTVSEAVVRFAYQPASGTTFVALGSTNLAVRGVATLNVATGVVTNLPTMLPAGSYPGERFQALVAVPAQACP